MFEKNIQSKIKTLFFSMTFLGKGRRLQLDTVVILTQKNRSHGNCLIFPTINENELKTIRVWSGSILRDRVEAEDKMLENGLNLSSTSIARFHACHFHEVEGGMSRWGACLRLVLGKDLALLVEVMALIVLGTLKKIFRKSFYR